MKKQLLFSLTSLIFFGMQNIVIAKVSMATQTLLNSFNNPYVSEQELINFFNISDIDIHATNNDGQNLLMLAAIYGYETLTSILMSNHMNPNTCDNKERTALMFAAQQGSVTNVTALLNAGANKHMKDIYGQTAKKYALDTTFNTTMTQLLSEKCDSPDQVQARYIKLQILKAQQAQGQQAIITIFENNKEI